MSEQPKKPVVLDEKNLMKAAQNMRPQRYVPPPRPVGEQLPRYEFKSQRPLMSYFPWKTLAVFAYLAVSCFFYYKYDEKSALDIAQKSLKSILTSEVLKNPLKKNPKIKQKLEWLQAEVKQKQKYHAATTAAASPEVAAAQEAGPALAVGAKFTFRYRLEDAERAVTAKDMTIQWELVDNQRGKLRWEGDDGLSINSVNPFLPPLTFDGSSLLPSEQNTIVGDPKEIFPLTPGKAVRYEVTPLIAGHDDPYEYTCTVGHQLSTVTAMGTLKTVRVDCASNEKRPRTSAFFYSPRMNHWVRQESQFYIGQKKYHLHAELTAFEPSAIRAPAAVSN